MIVNGPNVLVVAAVWWAMGCVRILVRTRKPRRRPFQNVPLYHG